MPHRTSPTKLHWDPSSKEVSFPLTISDQTVTCRIPQYVLKRAGDDADAEPLKVASTNFDVFLDVAVSKVNQQLYERDGSVLVRLMDLPDPPEPAKPH